jgi:hypothetical protein
MNPILKKLAYKGQQPILFFDAPPEMRDLERRFPVKVRYTPEEVYPFVLAFVRDLDEGKWLARKLPKHIDENTVLWVAYPKGTSKNYESDYNRDTGNALMESYGYTGVSLVSLDNDWSAMRFKMAQKSRPYHF